MGLWTVNSCHDGDLLVYLAMPSLISNFEYDIFISYRHNDNRSGWVTEFVTALQEELAATIKEPVSVYFDTNPHDGLLETHNVDKSLEGKLKCLIFIPTLSQTYCDLKSFAWQHEFCVFNKLAMDDQFGRDIRLNNGNVASRILPIKIHDLDADDKAVIENEIGGVLRAIEFIYKEPGVNRPLKPTDNKSDNQNKTDYNNQVNKVANAIKEIVTALKNPGTAATPTSVHQTLPLKGKSKALIAVAFFLLLLSAVGFWGYPKLSSTTKSDVTLDKSIAVLSFVDMSPSKDQEYLSDGIAEEIINTLSKINKLKVIGRTSSFQFKGEKVDLREVGSKLGVTTVVQGSVMKSENKIRVTAQLINVEDGSHIWSERYDRELKDVFFIQDEIATKIAQKLASSLLKNEIDPLTVPTTNMVAYEMTMKGNFFLREGPAAAGKAQEYYQKAIELDSNYTEAQLGYAFTYLLTGNKEELIKSINRLKSFNVNPEVMTDLMLGYYMWHEGNWKKSKRFYDSTMAIGIAPDISHAYYEAAIEKNISKAIRTMEKIIEREPLFLDGLRNLAWFYMCGKEYSKADETINKMIEINPSYIHSYGLKTEVYLREKKFSKALEECSNREDMFKNQKMFLNARIRAMVGLGKLTEARKLFYDSKVEEDPELRWALANFYFPLDMDDQAFEWLNKQLPGNASFAIVLLIDSFYDPYRNDPRYKQLISRLNLPE